MKLYKSLGVSIEFPIESLITLDYPSNACGVEICNRQQNQQLGLTFDGITLSAILKISFRKCYF